MLAKLVLLIAGAIGFYLLGDAFGRGVTSSFKYGALITSLIFCAAWFVYLQFYPSEGSPSIKFLELLVSSLLVGFVLVSAQLG